MSKIRFEKPKVKSITYTQFLTKFKEGNAHEILKLLILELTPLVRAKMAIDFIKETKYKSYHIAMNNFLAATNRYFENGDSAELRAYLENITDDYTEGLYQSFIDVRKSIIRDLLNNEPSALIYALNEAVFISIDGESNYEEVSSRKYTELAIEAATLKWPEAKSLKVLHGVLS